MIRNKLRLGAHISQALHISSLSCAVLHIFFIYGVFVHPADDWGILKAAEPVFGIVFSFSTLYLLWNMVVAMSKHPEGSRPDLFKLIGSNIFLILYLLAVFILMIWKENFNLSGILIVASLFVLVLVNTFFMFRRI